MHDACNVLMSGASNNLGTARVAWAPKTILSTTTPPPPGTGRLRHGLLPLLPLLQLVLHLSSQRLAGAAYVPRLGSDCRNWTYSEAGEWGITKKPDPGLGKKRYW